MIRCDMRTTSGDHTLFSTGDDVLSVAMDNTNIQLEVNGSIVNNSAPTGMVNLFITVDRTNGRTKLNNVTSATLTNIDDRSAIPNNNAAYFRLARGTAGDSNHQDNEYLDNGDVAQICIWERVLTDGEQKAVAKKIDDENMLIF